MLAAVSQLAAALTAEADESALESFQQKVIGTSDTINFMVRSKPLQGRSGRVRLPPGQRGTEVRAALAQFNQSRDPAQRLSQADFRADATAAKEARDAREHPDETKLAATVRDLRESPLFAQCKQGADEKMRHACLVLDAYEDIARDLFMR